MHISLPLPAILCLFEAKAQACTQKMAEDD
jgi:hypothetical protein